MKFHPAILALLAAVLVAACELYPMEPLRVIASTPETAVVDTAALDAVSLTFSADVPKRLIESSFTLEEDDIPLAGTFVWRNYRTVQFRPLAPFSANARYRMTLTTAAEDYDGNSLERPFIHEFRGTDDEERPRLVSVSPATNGTTDTVLPILEFNFSEPMDRSSVIDGVRISPSATGYVAESETHRSFRFVLTEELLWQTRYTVTIPAAG